MGDKITLFTIGSGYNTSAAYNANNERIEAAIDNTLSRDGSDPNEMNANIDMNSYRIVNLGEPVDPSDAARKMDVDAAIETGFPLQDGHDGQFLQTDGEGVSWVDITAEDVPVFIGDNGVDPSVAGLVPEASTGDAALNKFLKADGTWSTIADTGGTVQEVDTSGMATGGPITTSGTIDVSIPALDQTTDPQENDLMAIYDNSEGEHRYVALADLFAMVDVLTETTSAALEDKFLIFDDSASAPTSITYAVMNENIANLDEDSSPERTADYVMTYDDSAGTVKKVRLDTLVETDTSAQKIGVLKFGGKNLAQNTTTYLMGLGSSATATEANAKVYIPAAMYVPAVHIHLSAAVAAAQSITVFLRKNGANYGTAGITLTAGQQTGIIEFVDSVSDFAFDEGDTLSISAQTSATFGTTTDVKVSAVCYATDGTNCPPFGVLFGNTGQVTAAATVLGELIFRADSPSSLQAEIPLPDCVVDRIEVLNVNATSPSVALYRDGVVVSSLLTGAGVDARQRVFSTKENGTTSKLSIGNTVNSTSAAGYVTLFDRFRRKATFAPLVFSFYGQSQNTTIYAGGYLNPFSATEADVSIPMPACTVKNLRAFTSAAISTGESLVITVRKNGSDQTLTVTLNDVFQEREDVAHNISFDEGDLLSVKCVSSSGAGTTYTNITLEVEAA